MAEDYGKMQLGQLRQRIEAGDEEAAAFVADRMRPIQQAFKEAVAPLANLKFNAPAWQPPKIEIPDFESQSRENARILDEVARRRAREKRAAVEREQAIRDGIERLKALAEQSAAREIDSEARERRAEDRERRMFKIAFASAAFGAIGAVAAIIAIFT